jgi:hypothetical protein
MLFVMGTLVCNAGTSAQAIINTAMVPLSAQGDAQFSGTIAGIPASCATPAVSDPDGPASWTSLDWHRSSIHGQRQLETNSGK